VKLLESEIPYCLNREYCLTNKIFTYLLAGIALILSNTEAQKKFLQKYPGIGTLYNYDEPQSLALVLQYYIENKGVLAIHQENARRLAKEKLNWEVESKKFKNLVQTTLQS
jgi:glycosyltransferase involved in cell wall biosynthesis